MNDYNVMNDRRNIFEKPVKNNKRTYNNIQKIISNQGNVYATGYLLDYPYFKKYYKMIAIDGGKQ